MKFLKAIWRALRRYTLVNREEYVLLRHEVQRLKLNIYGPQPKTDGGFVQILNRFRESIAWYQPEPIGIRKELDLLYSHLGIEVVTTDAKTELKARKAKK